MPKVMLNVIKSEDSSFQCHYLLDVKEKVALSDIANLVKVGFRSRINSHRL